MTDTVIWARNLRKTYQHDQIGVEVLRGVDFEVGVGESHVILGASGAGKSTLMHLLGGLDHATGGEIAVCGTSLTGMREAALGRLRNRHLGFIYQFHHLLPEFSALENIAMPLLIRRASIAMAKGVALEWLKRVGLEHRMAHKPGELSGGERQRVALARALVTQPDCLLADEPTGNLDYQTAHEMIELMLQLNQNLGTSLVIVTHDLEIADRLNVRWQMRDGLINRESG